MARKRTESRSKRGRPLREPLIRWYEHNYFRGYVFAAKRGGRRHAKYFSAKPHGAAAALKKAQAYKRWLLPRLPWPAKVKRRYVRNRTGVIGVSRKRERARSGKFFVRYVAVCATREGRQKRASFSVSRYGEAEARRRAVAARRRGLAELLHGR
jgi:hypothetical protein